MMAITISPTNKNNTNSNSSAPGVTTAVAATSNTTDFTKSHDLPHHHQQQQKHKTSPGTLRGWLFPNSSDSTSPVKKNNTRAGDASIDTEKSITFRESSWSSSSSSSLDTLSFSTATATKSRSGDSPAATLHDPSSIAEHSTPSIRTTASSASLPSWTSNLTHLGRTMAQTWHHHQHGQNKKTLLQKEWSQMNHLNLQPSGAESARYLDGNTSSTQPRK